MTTEGQVYAYAAALAAAGGAITVCFFSVYRRAFGPARLGSIQGVAQMLTVLFSAAGPLVFASTKARLGTYASLFPVLAGVAAGPGRSDLGRRPARASRNPASEERR